MPYVRCPTCDLTTYTTGTPYGRDHCPGCDAELPRRDVPRQDPIEGVLRLARRELDMDAAFLGEITASEEIIRNVSGPVERFQLAEGMKIPLDDTVCRAVLEGRLPNVLQDLADDPACAALGLPRSPEIRAYIGVPLSTRDARRYILCCLARERRPELSGRDLHFLQGLAESARLALDERAERLARSHDQ
jgi:GAF domain-containing protein